MKIILIITIISLLIITCQAVDITDYSGDGNIELLGKGIRNGFLIDFGEFRMVDHNSETYYIHNIPKIDDLYNFGLYMPDSNEPMNGTLGMKLFRHSGEIIFNCQYPLDQWIVTESISRDNDNLIYYMDNYCSTSIEPEILNDINSYIIEVNYYADENKKEREYVSRVVLRVGGYK